MLVLPDEQHSCKHVLYFPQLECICRRRSLDINHYLVVFILIAPYLLTHLSLVSSVLSICEVLEMGNSQVFILLSLSSDLLIPHVFVDGEIPKEDFPDFRSYFWIF
jgi:hypothetical protein